MALQNPISNVSWYFYRSLVLFKNSQLWFLKQLPISFESVSNFAEY